MPNRQRALEAHTQWVEGLISDEEFLVFFNAAFPDISSSTDPVVIASRIIRALKGEI